jgi:leucyl-tRNA synthetase
LSYHCDMKKPTRKVKKAISKAVKKVRKTHKKSIVAKVSKKLTSYSHTTLEKKWQKYWQSKKTYAAADNSKKKKFYALIEFPYPSGDGLHVGHPRPYIGMDVIARKRRMEGYNVLYPIGWDAFGLPTENYAIKTGIQPSIVTKKNADTFRRQIQSIGISFDWSREINTTDPAYYRWTQWLFLQFFKRGLAYKKKMSINWCPKDLIGLANEEVINGKCERCGTPVEKREKEQWMLAITKYADRLDKDLDTVDYLERIKIQQRNWIGKSHGVNFKCKIKDVGIEVQMYNSVPQTYNAETFTVIAPEHALVHELIKGTEHEKPVSEFVAELQKKRAAGKFDLDTDPEGIFTGRYIENFAGTGRDLPIWIASYVVAEYGTGIVNASAHDERDWVFAKKYNIPLREVAEPLIIKTTGSDGIRQDAPLVERKAAVCIVKHWSEDKYLCLKWKANNWQGFVIGGIEGDENPAEAGKREIAEETGYTSAEYIKDIGGIVHSQFYHQVKKQNRFAHFMPLFFQLKNDDQKGIAQAEKDLHDIVWLSPEEVDRFVSHEDMKLVWDRVRGREKPIIKNGLLIEPAEFKGREWAEVREDIIDYLVKKGYAERQTNFKLRDWVFSRQRYWGEPIPVVHCDTCGTVAVPEKDLPIKLPKVEKYQPTETGESPLAAISKWVNVKCPTCKGPAKRETDTMPNWAGSSWYYLRYADPKNKKAFADKKKLEYWTPVDWYNGGMEHTTLHLLYSRFWHKFLFDLGLVPTSEPYQKRTSHGLILAQGGEKMSKSRGNVINPDSIITTVGADSLRLYEMFMGPFDQPIAWNTDNIAGVRRFIERVWKLREKILHLKSATMADVAADKILHKAIKKVSDDIESMGFNTAVSTLMITVNELEKVSALSRAQYEILLKVIAPFAPHVTEDLWISLGNKTTIHHSTWPTYDASLAADDEVTIIVQINGKMRGSFTAPAGATQAELETTAKELPEAKKWLEGKQVVKVIVVPKRLVNIVVV